MLEILTPLQHRFLTEFFRSTQEFYLTGGTALSAFYLQHRYSEDLDLFTPDSLAFQEADKVVAQSCGKISVLYTPVRITSFFKHFQIGSVEAPLTIHLSFETVPQLHLPNTFEGIRVDAIEEITVNKICAALGRTEIKDLIDLYFLDQAGYTIAGYFNLAQQKDAGLTWESLAYTLSQFDFLEIPSFMIKALTVEELQQFVETTIEWLIRKSAPPER
jgi:predicted nucleotidyltransferase component of viral defense system